MVAEDVGGGLVRQVRQIDVYFKNLFQPQDQGSVSLTMIMQCIRNQDHGRKLEPGTSAPEVWFANNEPPHLPICLDRYLFHSRVGGICKQLQICIKKKLKLSCVALLTVGLKTNIHKRKLDFSKTVWRSALISSHFYSKLFLTTYLNLKIKYFFSN